MATSRSKNQSDFVQRAFWGLLALFLLVGMIAAFQMRSQERDALRGKAAQEVFDNTLAFHPKSEPAMKELISCIKKQHFKITQYLELDDFFRPREVCPRYAELADAQAASPMGMRELQTAYSYLIYNLRKGI